MCDDIIKELAERLTIKLDFDEGGNAYWSGDHKLTVKLLLDDVEISSSTTFLPNKDRGSEY